MWRLTKQCGELGRHLADGRHTHEMYASLQEEEEEKDKEEETIVGT